MFEQHEELRTMLGELDKRLVVVVDDVDRLRPAEVLDIVRLVRLVGDFPNTLYLLAFDRHRVEECLGEGDIGRGRAYLEKIVQVTHDVPAARQPDVTAMFLAGLGPMLDNLPTGPFDRGDWQNILMLVIRPLLVTPRQVQRLLGSLSMTMRLIGDEIAVADLIGIEAVRVLHPALFEALVSVAGYLSATTGLADQGGYQRGRNPADSPIAPVHAAAPGLAEDVCRWLFPAARRYFENTHYGSEWEIRWRQQRKIASSAVFRFYLERQLPEGVVPARAVEDALSRLTDPQELRQFLVPRSPGELLDLLERMTPAIEELPVNDDAMDDDPARIGLPVLLDLLPRLPEDLGAFLRKLRESVHISQEDAGRAIRGSESKVCRLERGRTGIKLRDLTDLLELYRVNEDERITLLAMAAGANAAAWWHAYSDVIPAWFESYLGLEHAADVIRDYQVQFIPGLLQTPDYARAVLQIESRNIPEPKVHQGVALRLLRQQILHRVCPVHLWAVIDEAALRRPIGSRAIVRGQLQHLIEMTRLKHVNIQIASFSCGGRAIAAGPVTLLRFPEAELTDMVYLEYHTGAHYLNKPSEQAYYWNVLNRLGTEAPPPSDTEAILDNILRET